jgi:phosphoribosylanthranilate isomerase
MSAMEVKICGLTTIDDAKVAVDAGADYLGFVFYQKSPRAVSAKRVADIVSALGDGIRAVGVFVNETPERVNALVRECGLYAAQIHGDEHPEGFSEVTVPLWRAIWIRDREPAPNPSAWPAVRYVIDAAAPGQYGGAGVAADWDVAARIAREQPVMLAGGLRADNVAEGIRRVRPVGVDVSSGVEKNPGSKDHDAVRAFIAAAKHAELNN